MGLRGLPQVLEVWSGEAKLLAGDRGQAHSQHGEDRGVAPTLVMRGFGDLWGHLWRGGEEVEGELTVGGGHGDTELFLPSGVNSLLTN